MDISRFCQSWAFSTNRPRFSDYPTVRAASGRLPPLQASLEDIGEYQRRLWANRRQALLLVVHGTDTSGKDSLIRTLATYTDPAGFHAWSFSRPVGQEVRHDFLWRGGSFLPAVGGTG